MKGIAKAHACRRFSFAGRRRIDRRHQDQFAVGLACQRLDELLTHFGLVMAIYVTIVLISAILSIRHFK